MKIDTFPSKTFAGRVFFIAPEAEFTPKIIQTHKEWVKLVCLVKITIANPNLELKSGMPADAWAQIKSLWPQFLWLALLGCIRAKKTGFSV